MFNFRGDLFLPFLFTCTMYNLLQNIDTLRKIRNHQDKCFVDPLVLSAAISAGSSLISSVAGTSASANLNGRNRRWQEKMADIQYQRQNELLDKQNAYNDPSAARQRLEDAGFNASLLYGNDGNMQSSSGTASMANTPQTFDYGAQISQLGNNLTNNIANVINLKNAVKLNDANVRNVEEDTKSKELDNQSKAVQNAAQQAFIDKQLKSLGLRNDYQSALNAYQLKLNTLSDYDIEKTNYESSWYSANAYNNARSLSNLANLQEAQAKIANVDAKWADKVKAQEMLLRTSQISQAYENINLMRQQGMVYQADIALKGVQKQAQQLENDWNSFKKSGASSAVKSVLFDLNVANQIKDATKYGLQDIPGIILNKIVSPVISDRIYGKNRKINYKDNDKSK